MVGQVRSSCNGFLATAFVTLGHTHHGFHGCLGTAHCVERACNNSRTASHFLISQVRHQLHELIHPVISNKACSSPSTSNQTVRAVLNQRRVNDLVDAFAQGFRSVIHDAALGALRCFGCINGQAMTLLGFNVHQSRYQLLELGICRLAAVSFGDLLAEELQDVLEEGFQLLDDALCLSHPTHFHIRIHLQQAVEAFMRQAQCSKARQVIQLVPVGFLQGKHEVVQCLCVVLLSLGSGCPVTLVKLLHSQLLTRFHVESCQLPVSKLGIGFVAVQCCTHSRFHLLYGKCFLHTHTETRSKDLGSKRCHSRIQSLGPHIQGRHSLPTLEGLQEGSKRAMELLNHRGQEVAYLLLEIASKLAIVQRMEQVHGVHGVDLRSHGSRGRNSWLAGLALCHQLGYIVDQDGHAVFVLALVLTQRFAVCSFELTEQQTSDVLDEVHHSSNHALGAISWLHVELSQHIVLECRVRHTPCHELI